MSSTQILEDLCDKAREEYEECCDQIRSAQEDIENLTEERDEAKEVLDLLEAKIKEKTSEDDKAT